MICPDWNGVISLKPHFLFYFGIGNMWKSIQDVYIIIYETLCQESRPYLEKHYDCGEMLSLVAYTIVLYVPKSVSLLTDYLYKWTPPYHFLTCLYTLGGCTSNINLTQSPV